jgi:hypothetical protein
MLFIATSALVAYASSGWEAPSGVLTRHDDTRFKVVSLSPEWIVSPHAKFHAEQKEMHVVKAQAANANKVAAKRKRKHLMELGADHSELRAVTSCENAEDSAASAFTDAASKHATAEKAATWLSMIANNHSKSKHLFDAKLAEFNSVKASLCPLNLDYTTEADEFRANLLSVARLQPLADQSMTLEALMNGNLTIMQAARTNYSDMAGLANSADAVVKAREESRDRSCQGGLANFNSPTGTLPVPKDLPNNFGTSVSKLSDSSGMSSALGLSSADDAATKTAVDKAIAKATEEATGEDAISPPNTRAMARLLEAKRAKTQAKTRRT